MRARPLRDDERRAWRRLARTETVGPATFAALMAGFSDVHAALEAAPAPCPPRWSAYLQPLVDFMR